MSGDGHSGDLERLRAYVEGTLAAGERAAFEARLRAEPGLASLAEAYDIAREATIDAIEPPRVRFEDLRLSEEVPLAARRGPRGWLRPLAAAALVLAAVAVGWRAFLSDGARAPREPRRATLALRALPLDPLPAAGERPDWPRALLTDAVVDDEGHLVWRRDLGAASRLAHALGRPVLLFVEHETCPYCRAYDADVFTDRVVVRAAEPFVLVRLFWNECPPALMRDPEKGWPLFHLLDADGGRLAGFANFHDAHAFVERLGELRRVAEESGRFPMRDRERLRAIARRLDEAERAPTNAERWTGLRAVAEADPGGDLGAVARDRLAGLLRDAQAALFAARDAGPDRAAALLDAAAAEFAGTPPGEDLARVRDALRGAGAFPELTEEEG